MKYRVVPLREFFNYEHYPAAIKKAKSVIRNNPDKTNWEKISLAIKQRLFQPEEALILVNEAANQVLDENSDNEAHFWLDEMVNNIEMVDERIDIY